MSQIKELTKVDKIIKNWENWLTKQPQKSALNYLACIKIKTNKVWKISRQAGLEVSVG